MSLESTYERAAESLQAAIRFKTVSNTDYGKTDKVPFGDFESWLTLRYPRVHAGLEREKIGDWGLLYRWKAGQSTTVPESLPVLFLAHYDVVAASADQGWSCDPFAGMIKDGFVWGRGSLDIKLALVCLLDAAEALIEEGFSPPRDLYFAFGGDEEVGGSRGAQEIGKALEARGIRFEYLVDEGSMIVSDSLSFLSRPAALIGVAEKGHVNFSLTAGGKPGHASMPPRHGAVSLLSSALTALDKSPFPARLTPSLAALLKRLAPFAPRAMRFLIAHPGLAFPVIRAAFSINPQTDAMLRTTMAFTMLEASRKENVLPDKASANVNVRILPGETIESARRRIAGIAGRFGVRVSVVKPEQSNEALPEARVSARAYGRLEEAVKTVVPDAIVLPFTVTVGTDTRHYLSVCDDIYRITPVLVSQADLAGIHGTDERVSLENIGRCVRFYMELFRTP